MLAAVLLAIASPGPAALFGAVPTAQAVEPGEVLADPALERRAREIGKGLRCLVCQNQAIDDSDAELARDLRVLVRERLAAGDSDAAVVDYVVSRYGDFVLLKPPVRPGTWALWFGPALLLAAGAGALAWFFRGGRAAPGAAAAPLSAEEERRLAELLADRDR